MNDCHYDATFGGNLLLIAAPRPYALYLSVRQIYSQPLAQDTTYIRKCLQHHAYGAGVKSKKDGGGGTRNMFHSSVCLLVSERQNIKPSARFSSYGSK